MSDERAIRAEALRLADRGVRLTDQIVGLSRALAEARGELVEMGRVFEAMGRERDALREKVERLGAEIREADQALAEVGVYVKLCRPLAGRIRELAALRAASPREDDRG